MTGRLRDPTKLLFLDRVTQLYNWWFMALYLKERVDWLASQKIPLSVILLDLDEFTVAVRDASRTYRSWSREKVKSVVVADPLKAHREMLRQYAEDDIHNLIAYLVTLK